MYKFAEMSLDSATDPGYSKLSKLLSKTYKGYEKLDLKEELKDLNILSASDMELLPDNDFALVYTDKDGNISRRFPRADLDNSIVSALYLIDTAKNLPILAAAIAADNLRDVIGAPKFKYAAEVKWLLNHYLTEIAEKAPESRDMTNVYREPKDRSDMSDRSQTMAVSDVKEARAKLSDNDYVFVTTRYGTTHRLFPVNNKEALLKQAEFFNENHGQFELEHRHQFAKKLRDKAAELNVKLSGEVVSRYASSNWSPTVDLAIKARINTLKDVRLIPNEKTGAYEAHLAGDSDTVAALVGYKKLEKVAGKIDDIDGFASTLHKLDKLSGLTRNYGKNLSDPYSSTYMKTAFIGGLQKDLASASTMFAGIKITANDIMALDVGDLAGVIDDFTLNELKSDPIAVFNSLPIPYKSVIVEALGQKRKIL